MLPYGLYSPLGSSVPQISQTRILEWVAISFSRGSSQPRDRTWVSCIVGRFFTSKPPRKPSPPSEVLLTVGDRSEFFKGTMCYSVAWLKWYLLPRMSCLRTFSWLILTKSGFRQDICSSTEHCLHLQLGPSALCASSIRVLASLCCRRQGQDCPSPWTVRSVRAASPLGPHSHHWVPGTEPREEMNE